MALAGDGWSIYRLGVRTIHEAIANGEPWEYWMLGNATSQVHQRQFAEWIPAL